MKQVEIPFLARFEQPMLTGKKTLTTRTHQYGDVGDWFVAFGAKFQITAIARMLLSSAPDLWAKEGVESREEFMRVWSSLHRGVWNPALSVYVHGFKKMAN